jgi:hypothetical protein
MRLGLGSCFRGSAIGCGALLKSVQRVDAIEIGCGFGPRAFSMGVGGGGGETVFATSPNNLNVTSIALTGVHGIVVLISISELRPTFSA